MNDWITLLKIIGLALIFTFPTKYAVEKFADLDLPKWLDNIMSVLIVAFLAVILFIIVKYTNLLWSW